MEVTQKIEQLKSRIAEIDEKMKKLAMQKKDCERQIREYEEQHILSVVKTNGASIETIDSDFALVRLLKENNLTAQDIMELLGSNSQPQNTVQQKPMQYSQSYTQQNYSYGGYINEINEEDE